MLKLTHKSLDERFSYSMSKRYRLFVGLVILVLSLGFVLGGVSLDVYAQIPQSEVSLDLQRATWDHSALQVLIVTPQGSESWWQTNYADSALRAVGVWNDAFRVFATNYSGYSYLSRLRLVPTISGGIRSGFDVYVSWTDASLNMGEDSVGLATTYSAGGVIINSTIILGAINGLGTPLSEVDMQNVALHEFGHALGINHANYTADAMYPASLLGSPARAVSTLDVYGVAAVFGWMANSQQLSLDENWPKTTVVMLPPEIEYKHLEIASENIPPYSNLEPVVGPLRVILDIILMFVSPGTLILIVVIAIILVIALVLYRKRRRQSRQSYWRATIIQEAMRMACCSCGCGGTVTNFY